MRLNKAIQLYLSPPEEQVYGEICQILKEIRDGEESSSEESTQSSSSSSEGEESKVKVMNLKQNLVKLINQLPITSMPSIALLLSVSPMKSNIKQAWFAIEERVLDNNIHHLSLQHLCQLEYSHRQLVPKHTSIEFNKILTQNILNHLSHDNTQLNPQSFLMVAQALSKSRRNSDFDFLFSFLINNREALLARVKKSDDGKIFKNRSEAAIDMVYHWFSCKPLTNRYKVRKYLHIQNMEKLLDEYQNDILQDIKQVSTDHLARLAVAIYLSKLSNQNMLLRKIERNFISKIAEFDHINFVQILRSFSKCNYNFGFGNDTTFIAAQEAILQNNFIEKFSVKDRSEVMYAFANRRQGGPNLYQQFDKFLPQMIDRADNATMQNLIYYMLMREFNAKPYTQQMWMKVLNKTIKDTDILPLNFHRSHKMAWMYLKQKYPQMSDNQNILGDFVDRLFYAERYYNHGKLHQLQFNKMRKQHEEFKLYLYEILKLMPTHFHVHQNMWMIHYSWPKTKIGINLILDQQVLDIRNKRISGRDLLMSQILGMQGWEILNMTWHEYKNYKNQERNSQIEGQLKALLEKQKEKGIVPKEPVVYP